MQASIDAIGPLTVQAADGANTESATLSSPLPQFGGITASLPVSLTPGTASAEWSTNGTSFVRLAHTLQNPLGSPTFSGDVGRNIFLVEFTAATPRAFTLNALRYSDLAGGAPAASIAIDINNDGSFETTNVSSINAASYPVTLGPQPLQVRIEIQAALGQAAFAAESVGIWVEPDNNLQLTKVVSDCAPSLPPPPAAVSPSFENLGIDMVQPYPIGVMVLGLAPQVGQLSIYSGTSLPCLLLPRPDLTLAGVSPLFNLPIPASVRPITIYAQAVGLLAGELVVSDGYSIVAN
ncbi:MAG: hypothetical protein AB8H80_22895 [Planctomycetota bacterium]